MGMDRELVLLFKPVGKDNILGQLARAIDKHSYPGNKDMRPSLILVNKKSWTYIKNEMKALLALRYKLNYKDDDSQELQFRGIPILTIKHMDKILKIIEEE
jgi:hypothetical protein